MPDGLHLAASRKARLAFQRRDKPEDVAGRRHLEGVNHIRIAVRGDGARAVDDMEVKMRGKRRAAISEEPDHLAGLDLVADLDPHAARLEVGVDGA
jgi:hypothetical protein